MRVLLGVGAWVLGATTATGGSMYAVDRIGQDLFAQQSTQVSIAAVNAELARERSDPAMSAPSTAPPGGKRHGGQPGTSKPSSPSVLLVSPDGSAAAVCEAGGAYLQYWSPQQGYEADHVARGPAPVAQVTFRGGNGGVVLRVTCQAGLPVKHVSALPWSGHDE